MNLKDIKILKNPLQKEHHSKVVALLLELLKFKSTSPDDDGALNFIAFLFVDFDIKFIEKDGIKNLLLTKKFGEGKHICFVGHIDVASSKEELKHSKPFVENGYVYGHGAGDMKSGIAAFLRAVLETSKFNGTISILLTSDEDAQHGIKWVLENGFNPDWAILATSTSKDIFGDTIKIGKQGAINGTLTIKENPLQTLAFKFSELMDFELDKGDEFLKPSKFMINGIKTNSYDHKTQPSEIEVMFSVRNSWFTSKDSVYNYIKSLFKDSQINLESWAKPYLTSPNSELVKKLKQSIEKVCEITPNLSTDGNTNDARYFSEYDINIVEFGVRQEKEERVSIADVEALHSVFKEFLENF